MILTLKPPHQNGYANPHAYSPIQQPPSSTFSPAFKPSALPPLPVSSPRRMGTPHRGLPPPSAMTLPNPDRGPPSSLSMGPLSTVQMPAAPAQWHGAEENMRIWLQTRTEEERRKQEEQKTHQESLKLEQRKVEQSMLRESLQANIPPQMVPLVFAGMSGGPFQNMALEWAQQAFASVSLQNQQAAQIQQQQAQQQLQQPPQPGQATTQQPSSEQRRLTGPQPNPYGAQQMQQAHPAASPQIQQNTGFIPSYQNPNPSVDRARLPGPSPSMSSAASATRQPSSNLPRLNTVEVQPQGPLQAHPGVQLPAHHAIQQTQQTQQQEQQASSPIYFHHWVPPNTQGSSTKDPGTPTGKSQQGSPFSQSQSSYLRSDYTSSPKKRKATGAHQAAPAPTSGPPQTSPAFSHTSSGSNSNKRHGRSRQQSDASSRAVNETSGGHRHRSRTTSGRQSISEAESGSQRHDSAQAETRLGQQRQHHPASSATRHEPQERHERYTPKREREGSS